MDTSTAQDLREFRAYLYNCNAAQVRAVYEKERDAGRELYAEIAREEAEHRGIEL